MINLNFFSLPLGFSIVIIILAVMAWYKHRKASIEEKAKKRLEKKEIDSEYHNDFSKVPAGIPDELPPPPRSIGYGYGVGTQTMYEDLEKIGIVDNDQKNNKDDKKN